MTPAPQLAPEGMLTLREVAAALHVSVETVRTLCIGGHLRFTYAVEGRRKCRRVKRVWLDDYQRKMEDRARRDLAASQAPTYRRDREPNRLGV